MTVLFILLFYPRPFLFFLRNKSCSCTTCIVYQYFKELVAFVLKAGAKVRTLKHNFQMFRKFFFTFLFQGRSSERNLWQRREKWKLTAPFYCQNVKTSPPSFPKADAKVALLRTSAKYIQAFFEGLRELFHN